MATWLYQLNEKAWSPNRYRLEIWDGERWSWPVGKISDSGHPEAGDTVVFFYVPTGCSDPGFYGWAVVLDFLPGREAGTGGSDTLYFVPVAPSNHLKMSPWWDDDATKLADDIRGAVKQGTLWRVRNDLIAPLRHGITGWTSRGDSE